jgi:hypothetical protein
MVAKTLSQFMAEAQGPDSIDVLQAGCMELGFKDFKKLSGKRFAILTNDNRVELLNKIAMHFAQFGASYDPDFGSSSVGGVRIGPFGIFAAPKSKQGKASAGLDSEFTLIKMINDALEDGPLNVVFTSGSKKFTIPNAVRAEGAGSDTKGRKKSDVNVFDTDGNVYPLSLKKDKAEMWESADSYYGDKMKKIVDRELKAGNIRVEPHPKVRSVFTITPNLAVKASAQEVKNVVFGSDILPNGAVLEKTFTGKYKIDGDTESVIIDVSHIITSPRELKGNYEVYFLIRNDSSRKGSKIPGLRVLAVKKTRINRNVKVVK